MMLVGPLTDTLLKGRGLDSGPDAGWISDASESLECVLVQVVQD
jgi:hypothetical protein